MACAKPWLIDDNNYGDDDDDNDDDYDSDTCRK